MCLPHALQIVLICLGYHKCLIIPIFRHLTILGNRQNAQSTLWYYATVIQCKNIKYGGKWNNLTYMKFIYLHCGEETKLRDPRSWKKFRPIWDLNPWPLRYRCSALPTELTSQLGAGQCVGSKLTIQVMNDDFRYMKSIYLHCGEERSSQPRILLNF